MTVNVELDATRQYIIIDAPYRFKDVIKTLDGANWNAKESIWRMPVSWAGCLALRATFRADLEIGPKLTEWAVQERVNRVDPANFWREQMDAVGSNTLFPHQRAAVQFLVSAKQALLADEPGTGKTLSTISTLNELASRGEEVFPALVVAPNTVKKTWEKEFAKWWPEVRVQVIHGTATQRRKQFDAYFNSEDGDPTPQVFILNWESLRSHSRLAPYGSVALTRCKEHGGEDEKISATRCEVHERELNKIEFKSVIADEVHRSKDPKAKQTRALWAATGDAEYRYALTGTPIAKNVSDMWSILHWLNPTEWPSKSRWIDRMVDTVINAFGGIHILGLKPQMRDEFFAGVNPRLRRTLKSVVLPNLPPVFFEERIVEMGAKQKKAYEQMRDHMIAELEDGDMLMAPSPLTQMTRLLQFSVASAELTEDPVTGETVAHLAEPSATLDALMDDIESGDFGDDSIAISSASRQLLDLLSARLTKANIPHGLITGEVSPDVRQKSIDEFQAGDVKYILFTTQAGGVGITLTAARRLIRLLRPWSLVDDKQATDRIYRIGSEQHTNIVITDYITEGTVQERVQQVLDSKGENAEEVMQDRASILKIMREDPSYKPKTTSKIIIRRAKENLGEEEMETDE